MQEDQDFKWLHKKFNGIEDKTMKSAEIWKEIDDSYIRLIGLGSKAKRILDLKIELHRYYCDYIDGDKFSDNWIRITKNKIQTLKKEIEDQKQASVYKQLAMLQGSVPYQIDKWKMTVREFHEAIEYQIEKAA